MRRSGTILGLLGLALIAAPGAAMAQQVTFDVTGSAPQVCALQEPELTSGPVQNVRSLSGSTLQIEQMVDPQTLATRAAQAQISFEAVCTFPHRIVMESRGNGLWRNQVAGLASPQGFADGVPYSAVLNWGEDSDQLDADATSRGAVQQVTPVGEARLGALTIDLNVQSGASNLAANSPLLAGVYTDTLIVTLEPQ